MKIGENSRCEKRHDMWYMYVSRTYNWPQSKNVYGPRSVPDLSVLPGISAIDPRSCRHASPLSAIISSGRMPLSASVTSRRIIATGESGQSNWHNCPARKIDRTYRWEGVDAKKGPRFHHQIIWIYRTTSNTRGKRVACALSVSCPWNSVLAPWLRKDRCPIC